MRAPIDGRVGLALVTKVLAVQERDQPRQHCSSSIRSLPSLPPSVTELNQLRRAARRPRAHRRRCRQGAPRARRRRPFYSLDGKLCSRTPRSIPSAACARPGPCMSASGSTRNWTARWPCAAGDAERNGGGGGGGGRSSRTTRHPPSARVQVGRFVTEGLKAGDKVPSGRRLAEVRGRRWSRCPSGAATPPRGGTSPEADAVTRHGEFLHRQADLPPGWSRCSSA